MKKRVTSLILVAVIMVSLGASAYAAPSETEGKYIDIEIPIDMLQQQSRAMSPLTGTSGIINAYFPPGSYEALSPAWTFNFQDDSIPRNAQITNVTVTYGLTISHPGIICYVAVGRATPTGGDWCPDMRVSPTGGTVSTSYFNGQDPWGIWAIELYAIRFPPLPSPDYGAAATLSYATLRIYWV